VLRRHITLFDFLIEAAVAHRKWRPEGELRGLYQREAMRRWYGDVDA